MDENRVQEYLNLIQELLDCPSEEEVQILNANPDLLDAGLVETMELLAEVLEQRGNQDAANFLIDVAHQLAKALELSSSTPTSSPLSNPDSQLDFLMRVLRLTNESNRNPQVLYPVLQGNLDKLDDNFATILQSWAKAKLSEVDSEIAQAVASDIFSFSSLIKNFPLGSISSNLEIAIAGNEVAATVFTRRAFPHLWAMTQHNLGSTYCDRIQGDKAENLEVAICYYIQALQVHTREEFPFDWAMTQYSLGNAYRQRIKGDKVENLEVAIHYHTQALQVFTREAFPHNWATTQNSLGNAYRERIQGDKTENLEVAIRYYTQALQVFTREASPLDWAMTQHNLGSAYCDRIQGDKVENLEVAIDCLIQALQVRTRETFPNYWAMTQYHLGNAYRQRIQGDKAENLEVAIRYYTQAVQVHTYEAFPDYWARTQNNLGNAYYQRIQGDKAENLEVAIRYYTQALQVRTREVFPFDWAKIQHSLAAIYSNRIKGDRAENLEVAIRYNTQALQVRTREAFPFDWAETQTNLGETYRQRIRGDKAENLEAAIGCLIQALQVHTRETSPEYWARTQNNLGIAYGDRIQGDKAENLEAAIHHLTQALQVRTREAFPFDWARTQRSLAAVYGNRGDKAENLEAAIHYYTQALKVFTREAFPLDWAMTQNNLGINYRQRIWGDKAENLEAAIRYLKNALEIRTRDTLPQNHAETLFILGLAYYDNNQLSLAYDTFAAAIETVEFLRGEIVSGDEAKQKLAEEWYQLYSCMVKLCLDMSNSTQAIEYVERSKSRNLVELILSRDQNNIFPSEIASKLQQLQAEIDIGQNQLQNAEADNSIVLARHLQELRQQRNELQERYLPVGYGFKFDQFQATLDDHTAIIEWYITDDKILTFIIKPNPPTEFPRFEAGEESSLPPSLQRRGEQGGEVNVWQSTANDLNALFDWANVYMGDYYLQKDNWRTQLAPRLEDLTKILHLDKMIEQLPQQCDRLILIPHQFLHLFPLHALPLSYNGKRFCLLDLFPLGVSYAPSCQLLQLAQKRLRPNFTDLLAIQNPTDDLIYTNLEVQAITGYFQQANVLKKAQATLSAINNASLNAVHCAHFSCHGYFNLTNPGKSALILANAPLTSVPANPDAERYLNLRDSEVHDLEKCLTLDKIFSLNLEKCRLVTLSACETGLIDFNNSSDEYIGLPSGFLVAGSPAVVSSLWAVSDFSTAFLMIKFYEHLQNNSPLIVALNQAQQWLRNLTSKEFEQLLAKYKRQIDQIIAQLPEDDQIIAQEYLLQALNRKPYPFEHPFYWAAFTTVGI